MIVEPPSVGSTTDEFGHSKPVSWVFALIISFTMGWLLGTPQGNYFLWWRKTPQSPWIKDIKLMTNSPSLGRSMNTHNIKYRNLVSKWHKMVEKSLVLEWYTAGQNANKSCGPLKLFPKLNNSPSLQVKRKYQNCTISQGSWGSVHKEINDKCITIS